ncbi:hypothetical protein HBH71_139370 [Parastagonospora nodorum]|nr:hypothetical protein HBH71_139370 [Parastagonospora nodorum]
MTSSESEEQVPSRKRSRTSDDGGKEGKKARGRPRVEPQDATAADRRRTQIRLAQRAYRLRKETTISSLKSQSTQLHLIIDQMSKTFLRLKDATLKAGLLQLSSSLTSEFKDATEAFTNLAQTASEIEAGEDEIGDGAEQAEPTRIAQRAQADISRPAEVRDIGWGYSTTPDKSTQHTQTQTPPENYFQNVGGTLPQTQTSSLVPRRQFTVGEIWDQSRNSTLHYQPTTITSQSTNELPFGMVNMIHDEDSYSPDPQIYPIRIPTPDVTPPMTRFSTPLIQMPSLSKKTIASIFTYSHDETTLARRLTRATLEKGFHVLSNSSVPPHALEHIFKLSLSYLSLEQLHARFKAMLARSVNDDLDFWETPFIHLGGAGTHYPRKDANGNVMPLKNTWSIRQIGPLEKRMVRMESVSDGTLKFLPDMDLTAYEGEWFDAHDVQRYLEDKWACRMDPKSSFAQCLIDDDDGEQGGEVDRRSSQSNTTPSLTHSESNGSVVGDTMTPPSTTHEYPNPNASFGLDMSFAQPSYQSNTAGLAFNQNLGLNLSPGYDYQFTDASSFGVNMNLGLDMMSEVEVVPRQKRKKVAWVEITKLIDELIHNSVCLGRAPGFRRKAVDMAMRKALVPAS